VTAGVDRRYNDRDVRDDLEELTEAAVEYLEQYEGEFDFLVDMRMRVGLGRPLTVGMVRGVLNCMRNDPRVVSPPEPQGPEDYEYERENVVPIHRKRERRKPHVPRPQEDCPLDGREHDRHWFDRADGDGQQHCLGWHEITRDITYTSARFHPGYLRGRSSNIIHRSTHEGSVTWFPRGFHTYGQAEPVMWEVKPCCTPGAAYLRNPSALTAEGVRAAEPYETTPSAKHKQITLCKRCFPGTDNEELT